ncbi:hypothetical protein [Staphylococcus phage PT1-4]
MAERMVKCYGNDCEVAGIKHPSSKMKKLSGKNYCPDCYAKEIENRRQRDKLYEYICEVYKTPFVTPLVKKHINDFIASGLTYKRIYALIHYCATVKKGFRMPDMKYGIITLGNYYNEMLQYYADKKKQKEKNHGKINSSRKIVIDSNNYLTNKYKDDKMINMEDL